MRLRALLADDEINILKNLSQVIPWNDMDIEICALAKNGQEALEAAKQHFPDIILCDIRMPVMDGISFIEHVRELGMPCEVLLLTGYQDFEYARSAIRLNVKDYVLKPIDYEGLQANIAQIARTLRENRKHHNEAKKNWGKMLTLAYEKILFDVLMDYSAVPDSHITETVEIRFDELAYIMFLLDIEEYSLKSLEWSEKERKLWNFAVRNVIQEALQEYRIKYAVVQMREGEWCVLVEQMKDSPDPDPGVTEKWAKTLFEAVAQNVKLGITIGVYPGKVPFSELSRAYRQVLREVHLSSQNSNIVLAQKERPDKDVPDSLWSLVEEILSGLK
ncbi:MAG TPA: response regulator, partial [Bacilli bacterium]